MDFCDSIIIADRMVKVIYIENAQALAQDMFGGAVAAEELSAAAGALAGSILRASVWKQTELRIEIQHLYIAEYTLMFRKDEANRLYIWNDRIEKRFDAPKGALLDCHLSQVKNAPRLGVQRLELYAAGNRNDTRYNGYFVWPLYGYDAKLTRAEQLLLTNELVGVQTIQEIFARGGEEWWSQHGDGRKMVFDLAPDSQMSKRLQVYLRMKQRGRIL